ncbi:MAG: aspartate/glutamate racemase family protein [Permianibacter sp.]
MRTIGLIGGMSWESSAIYYRLLNEEAKARLGGLHSAQCLLYSVDFADIEQRQRDGDWDGAGQILARAAQALARGGRCLMGVASITSPPFGGLVWLSVAGHVRPR